MYCDECGEMIIKEAFYPCDPILYKGAGFCTYECMVKYINDNSMAKNIKE